MGWPRVVAGAAARIFSSSIDMVALGGEGVVWFSLERSLYSARLKLQWLGSKPWTGVGGLERRACGVLKPELESTNA